MPTAAPVTFPFMPSTSFELSPGLKDRAEFWLDRVGGYLQIVLLDDPAWLALMFC